MALLDEFRDETRAWLEKSCPPGARGPGEIFSGSTKAPPPARDVMLWLERMAERGWTAPRWPTEYGGGGLDKEQSGVLQQEMRRIGARPPLAGRGLSYIGPTLLEYGTEEQKRRLLPPRTILRLHRLPANSTESADSPSPTNRPAAANLQVS